MVAPEKIKEILDRDGDVHLPVATVAGKYLGMSVSTVYRMLDDGDLAFVLAGRQRGKRVSLRSVYEHLTKDRAA